MAPAYLRYRGITQGTIVHIRTIALAAAALAALAPPALSQEWTGLYVGAQAGYAFQDSNDSETVLFDRNLDGTFNDTITTAAGANAFSPGFCGGSAQANTPGACKDDEDGFDLGVRAGYDLQFGRIVVGGVLELNRPQVTDYVSAFSTTPAFYTLTREVNAMVAARARAGFVFNDNLVYVTGGWAKADIDNRFSTGNAVNTFVLSGDDEADGHQLGVGAERRMGERFTVGVEYLYTSLEDDAFRVRAQGPAPATNPFILGNAAGADFRRSDDELTFSSVRLTAAYRF
jgi:outer membrane immunogenic protein